MAGWFEAFSDFARGAAPAMDRYQMLRQLDQQNQFKIRQQEFQERMMNERMGLEQLEQTRRGQLMDRQLEQLDQSIMGMKQKNFQANRLPMTEMTQPDYQQAQELDLGGLTARRPGIQPSNIDLSGLAGTGLVPEEVANAPQQQEMDAFKQNPAFQDTYAWLGTPEQQMAERQRRLMLSVIQGLDADNPTSILQGQLMAGEAPNLQNAIPKEIPYQRPIAVTGQGVTPGTLMDPRKAEAQGLQQYFQPRPTGGGNQQIQNLDPETQAMVERAAQALASRQMSPSQLAQLYGGMGGGAAQVKRAIADRALKLDPTLNLQELESNYVFGRAPGTQTTVRFIDNIQDTIPVLEDIVGKMKLGNIQIVNRATLATQGQFGKKEVAQFEFAQTLLADEIAKILQGGGTGSATSDAKLRQALDLLDKDMSPQQWEGVLETAREMLKTRRKSLTEGTYMDKEKVGGSKDTSTVGKTYQLNPKTGKWELK